MIETNQFTMNKFTLNLAIIFLLNFSQLFANQAVDSLNIASKKQNFGTLFNKKDTLNFNLIADMKTLLRDRGTKPIYHSGKISYKTNKSKNVILPIKIRVRGNFRKRTENCSFPPLLLNFDKKNKGNSVFNRQNRLKLVTHCITRDNIVKEELVYQIYNILTDQSFKTRLARVTYTDSAGKRKPEQKMAFLLEDELILGKRLAAKPYVKVRLRQALVDSVLMARVALFQFMIGNTDWSVPYQHNIKLYTPKTGSPIPVPYDFDHSGIVNASYALPAAELNIASVRERLYRGIAYSQSIVNETITLFLSKKESIYQLYEKNKALDKTYIKNTIEYLDEFYEIIQNPKKLKTQIIDQGQKNAAGGVIIKGLGN